jgi:hypothetical protein
MTITFHKDSSAGLGSFILVLNRGMPLGRIFHTEGVYRFYIGREPKLGGAELEDTDLEQLEKKIDARHGTSRT